MRFAVWFISFMVWVDELSGRRSPIRFICLSVGRFLICASGHKPWLLTVEAPWGPRTVTQEGPWRKRGSQSPQTAGIGRATQAPKGPSGMRKGTPKGLNGTEAERTVKDKSWNKPVPAPAAHRGSRTTEQEVPCGYTR